MATEPRAALATSALEPASDSRRTRHEQIRPDLQCTGSDLVARQCGFETGLDIAVGPEDTVFYIQADAAWR